MSMLRHQVLGLSFKIWLCLTSLAGTMQLMVEVHTSLNFTDNIQKYIFNYFITKTSADK